ncbi:MAG: MFS transporter, partial [Pyrinomonadaceae bacterium]|nr:MFS transporter [Pyrinomonadaceae bacterium]
MVENQNEANDESRNKTSNLPPALRAFKHYNYRLFFSGQLISLSGAWMQSVAQSWLVYKMTDSAVLLGFIGFSGQIPVFLFAPFGGAIADEYNRQRILIATQVAMMILAFALAWLTLTNQIEVWHVFCLAALGGIASAFDIPTRQSFVADLVGKKDLVNAIALNSSMFNGARIIGPAIAGILVASIGEGWCFFVNGVTYTAVITSLLLMKIPSHEKTVLRGSTLDKIREGFVYVGKTHPIRDLLYLLGFVSLIGTPYAVLMPIFADKILNGGASGLGILMGATGVGALAGALSLAMRSGIKGLGRWV